MSIQDLAWRRSISLASAKRLVRRRRWQTQPANDGNLRVLVPTERRDDRTDAVLTLRLAVDVAHETLETLRGQLSKAEERAQLAEDRLADSRRGNRWLRAWRAFHGG